MSTQLKTMASLALILCLTVFPGEDGNLVPTTIFHAAQSFFVIVNEGIPLEQQAWLMAGVYLALALIVAILSGSQLSRSPTASRVINPAL